MLPRKMRDSVHCVNETMERYGSQSSNDRE
jgi:hypothetical protein